MSKVFIAKEQDLSEQIAACRWVLLSSADPTSETNIMRQKAVHVLAGAEALYLVFIRQDEAEHGVGEVLILSSRWHELGSLGKAVLQAAELRIELRRLCSLSLFADFLKRFLKPNNLPDNVVSHPLASVGL